MAKSKGRSKSVFSNQGTDPHVRPKGSDTGEGIWDTHPEAKRLQSQADKAQAKFDKNTKSYQDARNRDNVNAAKRLDRGLKSSGRQPGGVEQDYRMRDSRNSRMTNKFKGGANSLAAKELAAGVLVSSFLNSKVDEHKYTAKESVARLLQKKRTKAVQESRHNKQVARKRAQNGR